MALDIPKFYRQARAQFAVRRKSSNQLLGYALLLPEVTVEDNEVRLVPWLDDDLLTDDAALAVDDKPQPAPCLLGMNSSRLSEMNLNLSASNEASSQNTTLTSQSTTDVSVVPVLQQPAFRAGFNASLSQDQDRSSTPEQMLSLSSSPSSLPNHMARCNSPASSASLISRLATKPQVSPSCLGLDNSSLSVNLNLSIASEDPSQNTPLKTQIVRDMTVSQLPACQADFNASLSQDKAPSSTPQQMPSFTSPNSQPSPVSQCISPVSSASQMSRNSNGSSYIPIIPNVSPNSAIVMKGDAMGEVKAVDCDRNESESSVSKRKLSEKDCLQDSKIDNEAASKPKHIKLDANSNKNPEDDSDGQFLPGAVGRYDVFLEDVFPDMKLKTLKFKKVRCILCGDGRVFSYCNIGRHIKAVHEPPVTCEFCHKEFSVVQLIDHKKKWHKEESAEDNNNVVKSDTKVDDVKLRSEVLPPSATLPVVATVKNPTTHPASTKQARSDNPDHNIKSYLSTSNPTDLTKANMPSQVEAKLVSGDLVSINMTSVTVKGVSLKMGLERDAKIKKAMKKFGKRFNVDYKSLKFFQGNTELSGGELVNDLDGIDVLVFGEFAN